MEASALVNMVMRPENLLVMASVWALMTSVAKSIPKVKESKTWARIAPLLPMVLCVAAMFLPGVKQEALGFGEKILLGVLLGFASGHLHKVVKQTFMGQDERIEHQPKVVR